jgi:hypothetical protein
MSWRTVGQSLGRRGLPQYHHIFHRSFEICCPFCLDCIQEEQLSLRWNRGTMSASRIFRLHAAVEYLRLELTRNG